MTGHWMAWILAVPLAARPETQVVNVCVDGSIGNARTFQQAMRVAHEIYKEIGVELEWRCSKSPGLRTLRVGFEEGGGGGPRRAAMAYALPYEGRTIRIRKDCVNRYPEAWRGGVLGYILAHEIGHLLQGIDRHSEEGLMKATWNDADHHRIFLRTLRFTRVDVDLILRGLATRERVKAIGLTKP